MFYDSSEESKDIFTLVERTTIITREQDSNVCNDLNLEDVSTYNRLYRHNGSFTFSQRMPIDSVFKGTRIKDCVVFEEDL